MRPALALAALAAVACATEPDPRIDVLLADLADLEARNAALLADQAVLQQRLDDLEEAALREADLPDLSGLTDLADRTSALEAAVEALEDGAVDPAAFADAVARLATLEADAMRTADLAAWLAAEGYATAADLDAAILGLATEAYVDAAVAGRATPADLADALVGYATESYVDGALTGLATEPYVDAAVHGLATESYVDGALTGLATESYVDDALAAGAITSPTTWTIDPSGAGDFLTLEDAVEAATARRLDATLTLQLVPGTHALTGVLEVDHPQGNRLRIVGDHGAPGSVVLLAAPDRSAVYVPPGATLGLLDGLTIREQGSGPATYGLRARASHVAVGSAVVVEGFDSGVSASVGGIVVGAVEDGHHLTIAGARYAGVYAVNGSYLYTPDVEIRDVPVGARGIFASRSATVWAGDATVLGDLGAPGLDAAYAEIGSTLYLPGLMASGMTAGAVATGGSHLNASQSTLDVSGRGFGVFNGASARVTSASVVSGGSMARLESGGTMVATGTAGSVEAETDTLDRLVGTLVTR